MAAPKRKKSYSKIRLKKKHDLNMNRKYFKSQLKFKLMNEITI